MELGEVTMRMRKLHKELMYCKDSSKEIKLREQFVELQREYGKLLQEKDLKQKIINNYGI